MPIFEEMVPCGTKRPYSQTTNGMDNMTKEELKALGLTEEQVAKVSDDYEKNYVEKSHYTAKEDEPKAAKEESKAARGELNKLKKDHKDNAVLVKQIDDLKVTAAKRNEEHAAKVKAMEVDAIAEKSSLGAKAKTLPLSTRRNFQAAYTAGNQRPAPPLWLSNF